MPGCRPTQGGADFCRADFSLVSSLKHLFPNMTETKTQIKSFQTRNQETELSGPCGPDGGLCSWGWTRTAERPPSSPFPGWQGTRPPLSRQQGSELQPWDRSAPHHAPCSAPGVLPDTLSGQDTLKGVAVRPPAASPAPQGAPQRPHLLTQSAPPPASPGAERLPAASPGATGRPPAASPSSAVPPRERTTR